MCTSGEKRRVVPILVLLASLSCGHAAQNAPAEPVARTPQTTLEQIRAAGELRVIVAAATLGGLPRTGSPGERELALVEVFARSIGVGVRYVKIDSRADLLSALLAGRGDLLAAHLTRTAARMRRVSFTNPIRYVRELVVARKGAKTPPRSHAELADQRVWLRPSSSFAERLGEQLDRFEGRPPRVQAVDEHTDTLDVLARVGSGRYELTIADSDSVEAYLAYSDDVEVAFELTGAAGIGWAVRPDSPGLLSAANGFVSRQVAVHGGKFLLGGDLESIRERGLLRVIMANEPTSFFFYRGVPTGYQFTLAQRLARKIGVRLEVVVPRRPEDAIRLLQSKHADLIAATLTVTGERKRLMAFSEPLATVDELLVQPAGEAPIESPEQLRGRAVHVRRTSAYWETLAALQATVPGLRLVPADESLGTPALIAEVAAGRIPLTAADWDIVAVERRFRKDVQGTLVLGRGRARAFALRHDTPALLALVNTFVATERRRLEAEAQRRKPVDHQPAKRPVPPGALSPFDREAKETARRYDLDWRMLVAWMQTVSGSDPSASSWLGEKGLLQMMPHVARRIGVGEADLTDPRTGLEAGARYLARLRDRLRDVPDAGERLRLALAAVHAGLGAVQDARSLARALQKDPNRWDGNVAFALALLGTSKHAEGARWGYTRGLEAAAAVKKILERWEALSESSE